MINHYSACLLIDEGKLLLKKDNLDLPTTKINESETTESAALRIAKEIGIDADIERFFALEFFSGEQVYTYLCNIKSIGELSNEYNWHRIDDIKTRQLSENLSAIIDKIKVIL